ncbi:MAG: hypothetical protein N3A02_01250 [Rectinema sp.]|nr:hypothetical protein [Rectinema sp.]
MRHAWKSVPIVLEPALVALRALRAYLRREIAHVSHLMVANYGRMPMIPVPRTRWFPVGQGWTVWEPGPWPEIETDGYRDRALRTLEFTVSAYRRYRVTRTSAVNRLSIIQTWNSGPPQATWLRYHGLGKPQGVQGNALDVSIPTYINYYRSVASLWKTYLDIAQVARRLLSEWHATHKILRQLPDICDLEQSPWRTMNTVAALQRVLQEASAARLKDRGVSYEGVKDRR